MRRLLATVRRHPGMFALTLVVVVVAVLFSLLIGLLVPISLLLLVVIGGLAVVLARVWLRRSGRSGNVVAFASVVAATLIVALAIQLVPYGRDRSVPSVTGEPAWATPETRQLMVRACFGCHSSEIEYPAYAVIAPISWAIEQHIDDGRRAINYSQFATDPGDADESVEVILDGSMPPAYYTRFGLHPEAVLSEDERVALINGLRATPGLSDESGD